MTLIEISVESAGLSFRQRWSHYIALIFAIISLLIGVNLRDSTLKATIVYNNPQAGITAEYPVGWLLDEGNGHILRVRDIAAPGFSTTIEVSTQPIGPRTSTRNIFDALSFTRGQTLAAYSVISEAPFTLPDESQTVAMSFAYVASQINPYLQNVPVVVQGIDVLVLARGQAIIISFLSDSRTYDANYAFFERFLESMKL